MISNEAMAWPLGGTVETGTAVSVDGLVYRIGPRLLLDGITFDVLKGQSVVITGRSGSGKSTILSAVLGMNDPEAGRVVIDGTDVLALSRARRATFRGRNIGVVFQSSELIPELTAQENVMLPMLLAGEARESVAARAEELLESVGVRPDTVSSVLSGGERQRAALARALMSAPGLVIADEPTGSLDAELRDAAAGMLFDLPRKSGCGLLLVTHDPAVAERADVHLCLEGGQLL